MKSFYNLNLIKNVLSKYVGNIGLLYCYDRVLGGIGDWGEIVGGEAWICWLGFEYDFCAGLVIKSTPHFFKLHAHRQKLFSKLYRRFIFFL